MDGFTEDDTVALTNLNGSLEKMYCVAGLPSDICHVTIRNIRAASYCTVVRLLNQGVLKLHDITVEDIGDCPHLDHGIYSVRVGDAKHMYGDCHSTAEETYNISVRNVYGGGTAVLHLAGAIGNLSVAEITAAEGTALIDDRRN